MAQQQQQQLQPKFGELVPYGDPLWYSGKPSPFYGPSHHHWRQRVRDFVEREIVGNCDDWDLQKVCLSERCKRARYDAHGFGIKDYSCANSGAFSG